MHVPYCIGGEMGSANSRNISIKIGRCIYLTNQKVLL